MQYSHSLIFFRHSYFSAMVNKFVPPTSSSSPSIPLQTSSSVSSSEQQTYPSHNNIEELYNKNINIETIGVNRNLNKKPNTFWKHKNTVSHKEGNYFPQHYHHTMKGGAIVVDLLSAFGLLHNISVHEPNVVLRPGAHSAAPAAVFSSSQVISESTARNVRLDLNHLSNWMYGDGSSSNVSSFSPLFLPLFLLFIFTILKFSTLRFKFKFHPSQ